MGTSMTLGNLGNLSIVTGSVNCGAGTDAALTSNDGSASLTRNAAGDYTITFGQVFLSSPAVVASFVDATVSTTNQWACNLLAVSTASANIECRLNTTSNTVTAKSDGDAADSFVFMAVGLRNR